MKISKILNAVYDTSVGWRPATGAIKPVHIANGLFRELLGGQYYSISELLAFVVPYASKKTRLPDPKRTYCYLVNEISDPRYAAFKDERYKERFERLRDFTRGLVGTDNAVFPQEHLTSFTLTCPQMISTDTFDREVGRFMSYILRGKEGDGLLGTHVLELLKEDPSDPITFLVSPLLNRDPKYTSTKSEKCSPFTNKNLGLFFANIEKAGNNLCAHEKQQGNRLATLQRVVHFACVSLLSYTQALSKNGKLENRIPLLLAMDAPKGSSLAIASEQSLSAFYDSFELWLAEQLAKRILEGEPLILKEEGDGKKNKSVVKLPEKSGDKVRVAVRDFFSSVIATQKGESPDRDLVNNRMSYFEQSLNRHLQQGEIDTLSDEQWALVIADTIVQCYLQEYDSGGPREFLQGLGRKTGIIYPHFQGRSKEKRIRPSVPILEMLVKSCCPFDNPISLPDFLDRLWETYGIIVGGRTVNGSGDHELLARCGVDVSRNDLELNTNTFIDHLVQIGLARRYPDNISYVGKYYA